MTNSSQEKLNMTTGTEDQTSPDEGDKFVSKRGVEFEIRTKPNGLFYIAMLRGGKTPPLCDELFTLRRFAEAALVKYLKEHDPLNLAKIPEKTQVGKSKNN